MISTMFFVMKKANCHCQGKKDGFKGRLKVAIICDILYLSGQGNFIFIRGKSENFEN